MYFRISINRFLDIHNSFLDIQKSIYGYPKIHFWISKNRIMDIQYSTDFLDIQKLIYGYPKIGVYFRISIIHFRYP